MILKDISDMSGQVPNALLDSDSMFPPEIFEQIFSFLQSDPFTLKTCCDALPALSKLAEPHLYALIIVHNLEPVDSHSFTPSQLIKLLSDNPRIAQYVIKLHIVIKWPTAVPSRIRSFNDREISPIFALLPRLESILLWSNGVGWRLLQDNFRSAFIGCIRSNSIKEVCIQGFHEFPLATFNDCANLKSLALDGSFVYAPYPDPGIQLEHLSIHHCSKPSLPVFKPWVKLTKPCSLDLRVSGSGDLDMLRSLLQICSESLTSLELGFGKECELLEFYCFYLSNKNGSVEATNNAISGDSLDIRGLPVLEKLTLHAALTTSLKIFPTSISLTPTFVAQILQALPSSLRLLTLHLHFHLGSSFPVSKIDWSHLTLLPCLATFHPINLRVSAINKHIPVPPDEILVAIERNANLMEMVRRGAFVVRAEDLRFRRNILRYENCSHAYSRRLLAQD